MIDLAILILLGYIGWFGFGYWLGRLHERRRDPIHQWPPEGTIWSSTILSFGADDGSRQPTEEELVELAAAARRVKVAVMESQVDR